MIGELFILKRLLQRGADSRARDGLPDFPHIDSTGAAIVRRYLDARSPIVALSGHLGNFELLAAYYAACGAGISVVGRSANYAPLNALIDELRRSYGVENIERANASSVSALRRALSEKRTLAVLIDQDTDLQSGFSPFFTLEAATPTAPIRLAIRQRLPILSTFIVRTGPLKHLIVTEEIEYNPDSPDAIQHILDTYSERLEALLSLFPEQWPWWHRRWRRRPGVDYRKESPRTTKKYIEWIQAQAEPRE
jgi:KDO2-lipid IV(A) lauroyltransferase